MRRAESIHCLLIIFILFGSERASVSFMKSFIHALYIPFLEYRFGTSLCQGKYQSFILFSDKI